MTKKAMVMTDGADDTCDNADCYFAEDWTLQIAPVLLEDDALFQCQVLP